MVLLSFYYRTWDCLSIYDGRNAASPMVGDKLCGSYNPKSIISSSNELFIRFRSSHEGNNAGFQLKVVERGTFE